MRRMDRYNENSTSRQATRSNKNQELYENIGSNTRYTNFTDVTNANAFNLDEATKNSQTREGYHKMKEYRTVVQQPKVKKELEEFKSLYQKYGEQMTEKEFAYNILEMTYDQYDSLKIN